VSSSLGGHERLYRALLRLYPADYRAHYSDQMVQAFADQRRDIGTTRAWLRAPTDVISTALGEHLRRNRPMAHSLTVAPTLTGRVLGTLGVIGGAVILIAFLGFETDSAFFNLRLVLVNLGALAVVVAVHRRQSPTDRWMALTGSLPAIITNGTYLILVMRVALLQPGYYSGDFQPIHLFVYVGAAQWLSIAWFGAVTFRLGVLSRWSAMALAASSLLMLGMNNAAFQVPGSGLAAIFQGGIAVHAFAWILLGIEVAWRRRTVSTH
jgi:hypothetical protein